MDAGINDRAQIFCKYKGITSADFERISGLANGMIKKLGEKTRRTTFDRISNAFPDLNMDWLRLGEGEMLNTNISMVQNGDGGVHQQGHAGTILNQTANSERIITDFLEGLKEQGKLTEKAMNQTEKAMNQTDKAMNQMNRTLEYLDKTINEISEQRKLMERIISNFENK